MFLIEMISPDESARQKQRRAGPGTTLTWPSDVWPRLDSFRACAAPVPSAITAGGLRKRFRGTGSERRWSVQFRFGARISTCPALAGWVSQSLQNKLRSCRPGHTIRSVTFENRPRQTDLRIHPTTRPGQASSAAGLLVGVRGGPPTRRRRQIPDWPQTAAPKAVNEHSAVTPAAWASPCGSRPARYPPVRAPVATRHPSFVPARLGQPQA